MPLTLFKWVRQVSGFHQCWLAILSALLFVVGLAPLEVQRQIVNAAVTGGNVRILILLAAAYFGLGIAEGLLKLGMNVYRGWVSENAVRWLRTSIASLSRLSSDGQPAKATGTEIAMTLSEAEPIGNFVGSSVSEPFLQGGILISVFAYMVYLQPHMALVAFGVSFRSSSWCRSCNGRSIGGSGFASGHSARSARVWSRMKAEEPQPWRFKASA